MDAVFAAIPAAAGASFLVVREAWRAWQPARLLISGRYAEARSSAEVLAGSWMRVLPGVRFSARYAIACALHFEGDLERSLEVTAAIDRERLSPASRYDVDSLDAASLVLLDRDPARTLELLKSPHLPEDRLLAWLASQRLKSATSGEVPTETVSGERGAIVSYLRGLYWFRAGQPEKAKVDLHAAANAPHVNVYTRRARALLDERRPAEDGPSSLAPQVVANRPPET